MVTPAVVFSLPNDLILFEDSKVSYDMNTKVHSEHSVGLQKSLFLRNVFHYPTRQTIRKDHY